MCHMPIASTDGRGLSRLSSTSCRCFRRAYPVGSRSRRTSSSCCLLFRGVAPWLRRSDLNAVLGTCMDLDRGVPDVQGAVVSNARIRSLAADTRSQSIRPDNLLRSACSTSTGGTVTMPSTSATFQGSVTGTLRWRTVARYAQRRAGSRATLRLKIGEAAQISLQAAVLVSAGGPVRNSR